MKPYYYVYRVGNGNSNVKHSTIESAQKEAERICNQHPGSVFEILKCLAIVQCTQASTFWMDGENWMDGEEPPEKPRYRMLEYGEIIQPGDEYDDDGTWRPRALTIGEKGSADNRPTRRPL